MDDNKILELLDQYFKNTDKGEILKDFTYANDLGYDGVSLSEYLHNLDLASEISPDLARICDDIAYSDLFNRLIAPVEMGGDFIEVGIKEIFIKTDLSGIHNYELSSLACAA